MAPSVSLRRHQNIHVKHDSNSTAILIGGPSSRHEKRRGPSGTNSNQGKAVVATVESHISLIPATEYSHQGDNWVWY
ncbi:hypothetical protein L6164_016535 [Bauhinia variegata]|uniref:Uncharacterized protein n=1 Tax=Bauhinia variegata TaxID=167791 RepID=A0ACB9NTF7_BAUVA|nr:hypothetical protein L6164_016535 [Bauhinia variegata]